MSPESNIFVDKVLISCEQKNLGEFVQMEILTVIGRGQKLTVQKEPMHSGLHNKGFQQHKNDLIKS